MPEDCYYPVTFDDDDDIGFFSIFDGYNEASFEMEKISLLVDSSEEESEKEDDDQEGLGSSDEEDLKKKWKASTKTTMNKYASVNHQFCLYFVKTFHVLIKLFSVKHHERHYGYINLVRPSSGDELIFSAGQTYKIFFLSRK